METFENELQEKVAEVKEDLELQVGYHLTDMQTKRLLNEGRTSIKMLDFVPFLHEAINYLHQSEEEDVIWTLSLNCFSGNFEITLKEIEINF